MPEGIVYEGVQPQGESRGGNVFEGLAFWVAQRVPQRPWFLDMIKNNGGEIVQLEKRATMCIADPLRPAPPGSYSFQFIEEAIKTGKLPDKQRFLIQPNVVGKASRVSAATGQPRGTRTPFTPADDAELVHFMLPHLHSQKARGNELFQALEQRNGRHTYQSWRDRWIKKYVDRREEELRRLAGSHTPTNVPEEAVSAAQASSLLPNATPRPLIGTPTKNPALSQTPAQSETRSPGPLRVSYTTDDDVVLIEAIREEQRNGKKTDLGWFKSFAEDYPHHSATSWYDHWRQVLKPRLAREGHTEGEYSSPRKQPPSTASSLGNGQQGVKEQPTVRAARNLDRPRNSDINSLAATVHETAERLQANEAIDTERSSFFENLTTYMKAQGPLNTQVDLEPKIAEKPVDLYKLFEIMQDLDVDVAQADWGSIAAALDFDIVKMPSAPAKIRKYWNVYLKGFFDSLEDESQTDSLQSGAEDLEERETVEDEEEEGGEETIFGTDELARRQAEVASPIRAKKRGYNHEGYHGKVDDQNSSRKRSRRSRADEIPSTPEHRLGISRQGSDANLATSEGAASTIPAANSRQQARQSHAKPETRDFMFERGEHESLETEDITPSQQLQAEEAATSPIPLHLPKRPPGGKNIGRWSQDVASASTAHPVVPSPQDDDGVAELSSQCERFQSLGYSFNDVTAAFRATTCDIGLAGVVMELLKQGKGLPNNMEGVWTERDDEGLRFVDRQPSSLDAKLRDADEETRLKKRKSEWMRLTGKHTEERLDLRRTYLGYAGEFS